MASDVAALLSECGLSQYLDRLIDHGLGTFEALSAASLDDLRKRPGLLVGHAKLLHKRVAMRKEAIGQRLLGQGSPQASLESAAHSAPVRASGSGQTFVAPTGLAGLAAPPLGVGITGSSPLGGVTMLPPPQASATAPKSAVGEALSMMKTMMGEKDEPPHLPPLQSTSAFDQEELLRRLAAAASASASTSSAVSSSLPASFAAAASAPTPQSGSQGAKAAAGEAKVAGKPTNRSRSPRLGRPRQDQTEGRGRPPRRSATAENVTFVVESRSWDALTLSSSFSLLELQRLSGTTVKVDEASKRNGYCVLHISGKGRRRLQTAQELLEKDIRQAEGSRKDWSRRLASALAKAKVARPMSSAAAEG